MPKVRLLADRHIFLLDVIQHPEIVLELFDSNVGLPEKTNANAMLVRTVTHVSETWLRQNPTVKFVGTASAGFDHLPTQWMEKNGLAWSSSPGCNSNSVAEWVMAALLLTRGWAILDQKPTVGIIGVGNAGSAVSNLLQRAGFPVFENDPPRMLREPGFTSASLEKLKEADVLTVHVPLDASTKYLLNAGLFETGNCKTVINASRGGVLKEGDAIRSKKEGKIDDVLIDVWEGEPVFRDESALQADVASPHIAGYSFRAKINATRQVTETMLAHFGLDHRLNWPVPVTKRVDLKGRNVALSDIHPLPDVDNAFRNLIGKDDSIKKTVFHELRQAQNHRVDWQDLLISGAPAESRRYLRQLGISCVND